MLFQIWIYEKKYVTLQRDFNINNLNKSIMDKKKSIEALQFFVTHLAEGAIVHKQQGMIFKAQGITKLGKKYLGSVVKY